MLDVAAAGPIEIEQLGAADARCELSDRGRASASRHGGSIGRLSVKDLTGGLIGLSVAGFAIMTWHRLHDAATEILPILWTLAPLLLVHTMQITLSAAAWSKLLSPARRIPVALLFQLRVIREGVDSLLPIAQVGGEMIASAALVRSGVEPALAAGGIVVDMAVELLGQLGFLTLGCLLLSGLSGGEIWSLWLSLGGMFLAAAAGAVLAHRLGALRLLESLVPRLARHVTATPAFAIAGLHETVTRLFASRRTIGMALVLHFLHWLLGAVEVWIVLRAMGVAVGPQQAIIMNAIGVGARSAGFAVPGSLVVQESGFMLGAALAGLPPQSALVFSLVRRLRELLVGGCGVALWRAGPALRPAVLAPAE